MTIGKKYGTPTELTAELLNTPIEKKLIHEPVKYPSGLKEQEIEIFSASSVKSNDIIFIIKGNGETALGAPKSGFPQFMLFRKRWPCSGI